ncbi:MAG: DUF2911 domain-containing protein [Niabella sp.]
MKKLLSGITFILCVAVAQAQLKTPAPSPGQTVKQDFALSAIELSYSRPGIKGRKVYGDLVPFKAVWRTGANGATTLTFGEEVIIGGEKIPAGKYGLLSIPDKTEWTLIITKQTNVTNPAAYKQEEDVVRVKVKPVAIPQKVETFTIQFANVQPESCELEIIWENTKVSLPIKADIDSKIMAQIDASIQSDKPAYGQAAAYYLENNKDINKAIEWYGKAVEATPNAFWLKYQYAKALAKGGKKADAKKMALQAKEAAVAAKNSDYVTLNEKLLAELK